MREVELAKRLLESKGYRVEKKVDESSLSNIQAEKDLTDREEARPRRGRRPNGDERDHKVFTPGSEEEKLSKGLDEAKEGLDYEEMKYWNPIAIGSTVAKSLGVDATEEELSSEISKIIDDEYDRGDVETARSKALRKALQTIEFEKEMQNDDPMKGHKYSVSGATPNVTETGTDYSIHEGGYFEDPKSAIVSWLTLSQKAPTDISIDTNKNAYAEELLQWVVDNQEEFTSLCQQYKCHNDVDYMIDACNKKLQRPDNFDNKYNYPDQIYPFAVG